MLTLATQVTGCTSWTLKATFGDVDTNEAAWTAPPSRRRLLALQPLLGDSASALRDVLAMIVAQVISKVVTPMKGRDRLGTSWIVANIEISERLRRVSVLEVPLEIDGSLKRARITARDITAEEPVACIAITIECVSLVMQ